VDFRTDLALERRDLLGAKSTDGIYSESEINDNVRVTRIRVQSDEAEKQLLKPKGKYVTIEVPAFSDDSEIFDGRLDVLTKEIELLLPKRGTVLVVGLGNELITPDALGPKVASSVLATRHISKELIRTMGLEKLRCVAVIAPGVLGRTGIETGEIVRGVADRIKPSAVITVDALASRSIKRLGSTIQICDTGISPGSGVGNARKRLDKSTLGVKVISIGVPTVVDAATLTYDFTDKEKSQSVFVLPESENMMVTPKEIDLLIDRASKLVSMAINRALQTTLSTEDILSLVS